MNEGPQTISSETNHPKGLHSQQKTEGTTSPKAEKTAPSTWDTPTAADAWNAPQNLGTSSPEGHTSCIPGHKRRVTFSPHSLDANNEVKTTEETQPETQDPEAGMDSFRSLVQQATIPDTPAPSIAFENLSWKFKVPRKRQTHTEEGGAAKTCFHRLLPSSWCSKTSESYDFVHALNGCSGTVGAGSMTLVVAPPGHGKSSFLRALSKSDPKAAVEGKVSYLYGESSVMPNRFPQVGAYMDQVDVHLPSMTVEETIRFICNCYASRRNWKITSKDVVSSTVNAILELLDLRNCAATRVGNRTARGISGGQRRRLSIAEMLLSPSQVLVLDEPTTGLDSATAFNVIHDLRRWCKATKRTVICSLLQPGLEVAKQFDAMIVLSCGKIIYNDSLENAPMFLNFLGVNSKQYDSLALLTTLAERPVTPLNESNACFGTSELYSSMLVKRWQEFCSSGAGGRLQSSKSYTTEGSNSLWAHSSRYGSTVSKMMRLIWYCLQRQMLLTIRNTRFVVCRCFQALFFGVLMGALYWDLEKTDFQLKFGAVSFAVIFLSLSNLADVPLAVFQQRVAHKQLRGHMYSPFEYGIAILFAQTPIAMGQILLLGTPIYWMTGMVAEPDRFFFFLFILLLLSMTITTLLRTISYATGDSKVGQAQGGALVTLLYLFGGFFITRQNIPVALRWIYWVSPMSWTTTSLMQNELNSYSSPLGNSSISLGQLGLETFEIPTPSWYRWSAIGFLGGGLMVFSGAMILALRQKRINVHVGSKRIHRYNCLSNSTPQPRRASQLSFVRQTLAFRNVSYAVKSNSGRRRKLITDISGIARPGTLTALLGASGSGKTTLLDVLVGRKTSGEVSGEVLFNGRPKQLNSGRLTGYVEQQDLHMPFSTVWESLRFAAELRLPRSTGKLERDTAVEEALSVLELGALRNVLVGDPEGHHGYGVLSPSERKKLSIGLELVANPPILVLDEPTTSLDFQGAISVIRVMRNIVETGRTVICSVHQPSPELFSLFDEAIIMQSGGRQIYSGPIGTDGNTIVEYFHSIGIKSTPKRDLASWIQEITVCNDRSSSYSSRRLTESVQAPQTMINLTLQYKRSGAKESLNRRISEALVETDEVLIDAESETKEKELRSFSSQVAVLVRRICVEYWRNKSYTWNTLGTLVIPGILFGVLFYDARVKVHDKASLLSLASLLLLATGYCGVMKYQAVVPLLCGHKPIYCREVYSRMYTAEAYILALCLVDVAWTAVVSIIFSCSYYFLAGFESEGGTYCHYVFVAFLFYVGMTFFGMIFAAAFSSTVAALSIGSLFIPLKFLFSGVYITKSAFPAGLSWLHWINPMAYAIKVMAALQLYCIDLANSNTCPKIRYISKEGMPIVADRYAYAKAVYGFDYDRRWEFTLYLFIFAVVYLAIATFCLRHGSHIKR
eukprot:gb/GECG01000824.1/.p1 GENE.gb/GECG01000824.1/~~gb/GECG01000824.1/.p1  ORF type:complete len:1412 (+),score=132.76 gb/GECG01000824.1/:1-4236(+)